MGGTIAAIAGITGAVAAVGTATASAISATKQAQASKQAQMIEYYSAYNAAQDQMVSAMFGAYYDGFDPLAMTTGAGGPGLQGPGPGPSGGAFGGPPV